MFFFIEIYPWESDESLCMFDARRNLNVNENVAGPDEICEWCPGRPHPIRLLEKPPYRVLPPAEIERIEIEEPQPVKVESYEDWDLEIFVEEIFGNESKRSKLEPIVEEVGLEEARRSAPVAQSVGKVGSRGSTNPNDSGHAPTFRRPNYDSDEEVVRSALYAMGVMVTLNGFMSSS